MLVQNASTQKAGKSCGAAALCALFVLLTGRPAYAQADLVLENIDIHQDQNGAGQAKIVLTYSAPPSSFPVYAMTAPQRIIIDMADTRMKEGLKPPESELAIVEKINATQKSMGGEPNTRLEVVLKQSTHYRAYIDDTNIVLHLSMAGKVKQHVSVLDAARTSPKLSSLESIDIASLERGIEMELKFTTLPMAASIYMLAGPHRLVMDFNNVFVEKGLVKQVEIPPIEKVSVIKKEGPPPYAGVVAHLKRTVEFQYQQLGKSILVSIPWDGAARVTRRNLVLIGTGVILAGGAVTGILLGGEEEQQKPPDTQEDDLGAPPALPEL